MPFRYMWISASSIRKHPSATRQLRMIVTKTIQVFPGEGLQLSGNLPYLDRTVVIAHQEA
eukprot:2413794-Pyramimonas_sp.AAC.3